MAQFDVRVFLTHCFVPAYIQVDSSISVEPFEGIGVLDVTELVDHYVRAVLHQPAQPTESKLAISDKIRREGSCIVIKVARLQGADHHDAIAATQEPIMRCRDILALRQLQRGQIAAFLSVRTDVSPVELYAEFRRPYAILRRVRNIPTGLSEQSIFGSLYSKAANHPLLRVYLSLYADTVAHSDTLVTDISIETRLMKTWSLLETMALGEEPSHKKEKVRALFQRYSLATHANYRGHTGKDLLDVAYTWRNAIAHSGGCQAATDAATIQFCRDFSSEFEQILEDLSQDCCFLLHAYASSLP